MQGISEYIIENLNMEKYYEEIFEKDAEKLLIGEDPVEENFSQDIDIRKIFTRRFVRILN